jgi:serine/threonine-protein kinase
VKVLPQSVAHDPSWVARFEREARAIARLSHPHIVVLHDLGRDHGTSFVVMELVQGESLRRRLAPGPLPLEDAIRLAIEAAAGLAAVHAKGSSIGILNPRTCS